MNVSPIAALSARRLISRVRIARRCTLLYTARKKERKQERKRKNTRYLSRVSDIIFRFAFARREIARAGERGDFAGFVARSPVRSTRLEERPRGVRAGFRILAIARHQIRPFDLFTTNSSNWFASRGIPPPPREDDRIEPQLRFRRRRCSHHCARVRRS